MSQLAVYVSVMSRLITTLHAVLCVTYRTVCQLSLHEEYTSQENMEDLRIYPQNVSTGLVSIISERLSPSITSLLSKYVV
jgi:outer membrane lipopolysaccharide assembly protein LptE/RlpB